MRARQADSACRIVVEVGGYVVEVGGYVVVRKREVLTVRMVAAVRAHAKCRYVGCAEVVFI